MRIVSLLPSATELLCSIPGGEELLVGRSHECDWPPSISDRPVLTGQHITATSSSEIDSQVRDAIESHGSLYTLDAETLSSLQPDLILTQDLCTVCSIDLKTVQRIAAGMTPAPRVLNLNPSSIEDVLDEIAADKQLAESKGVELSADRANDDP